MKFVSISGGLGNQMFIYAFYISIAAKGYRTIIHKPYKTNSKYYGHQGYELKKIFSIKHAIGFWSILLFNFLNIYSNFIRIFPPRFRNKFYSLIGIQVVEVPENFIFYPEIFKFDKRNQLFRATWQSQDYFKDSINEVRKIFNFNLKAISFSTKNCLQSIKNNNSVSIHIRRGDYLSSKYVNGFGGICNIEYYQKAMLYIESKVKNPYYYVFTDDDEWVRENFQIDNAYYVNHNKGQDSWQDMFLMSNCKHNIIANSSFSWWGAWLNLNNSKIVIAPKRWWKSFDKDDVIPESWIRM